ncbi:hypothetical protein OIDMADRAFT_20465 [Oidiodendron maius Zn]|uniref:Uncharacterized protein n=1 Tax=Oidiodendron maius (strain Zn) TaxID=913774 RepID=A0A0C3H1H8_OIDMZ|nr:hypothetical protein OIDMADRAFT_20465 [Oidiodendron maius Zn]
MAFWLLYLAQEVAQGYVNEELESTGLHYADRHIVSFMLKEFLFVYLFVFGMHSAQ